MEITKDLIISKLPDRPLDANKGTFGSVLIIAGSRDFPGAAILSVLACARIGAGLITLATTSEVYKTAVPKIPFATFLNFSEIDKNLEKYDSILIGPGLGQSEEVKKLVDAILSWKDKQSFSSNKKIVLDADALNILSKLNDWSDKLKDEAILTPHPGEMGRLTGLSVDEIQDNREEITKKYSKIWNKIIILKGAKTVIANPAGEVFVSPFSNPLLATAGTGDVLSGIIVGFLAQGLSLIDASIVGVYIHGLAGEKLKERFGDSGAVATDLIETIPEVMKDLKSS